MLVRTRFAPSPTGYLHIGGVRTALFAWLYARQNEGVFVLRIEDTDQERSTQSSVDAILDGLKWLGLDYDEGPFFQTKRLTRYREVIGQLLESGHAYRCDCSKQRLEQMRAAQSAQKLKPRYDGCCRQRKDIDPLAPHVVRFRNPDSGAVVFEDLIKGPISINNEELDDLVILRSDGFPTYNLSVVVDDYDMRITHVIRGDDHINNTPRQINILNALDADLPSYGHVPMILGADGKRLSKRQGAVSVTEYREQGFLPEALLNYLVRLGWASGDQEIFSRQEMIELFTLNQVNRAPSTFNPDKLVWLNQHYIQQASEQRVSALLLAHLRPLGVEPDTTSEKFAEVIHLTRDRAKTLVQWAETCVYFFKAPEQFDPKAVAKHLSASAVPMFEFLIAALGKVTWDKESIKQALDQTAETLQLKFGDVALPVRVAVTGSTSSPSIDETLRLIGCDQVLARLGTALELIASAEKAR